MPLTPAEVILVENIAREQIKYETVFSAQAAVLRTNPLELERVYAKVHESPIIAKGSQPWVPTPDRVDEYLAHCDSLCFSVPDNFEDRMKIACAAHAALMCIISCKIAPHPERVRLAVLRKHHEIEICLSTHPTPPTTDNPITDVREPPLSKPSVDPRHITAEEFQLFQNPDNLLEKQFLLMDSDDPEMYEVVGYSRKRGGTVTFDILFDDGDDVPFPMDMKDMMGMLKDSLYFSV